MKIRSLAMREFIRTAALTWAIGWALAALVLVGIWFRYLSIWY